MRFGLLRTCSKVLLFFELKLIVFFHHNSKLLHFLFTKICKGVMIFTSKNYFSHKCVNLVKFYVFIKEREEKNPKHNLGVVWGRVHFVLNKDTIV